MTSTDIAQLLFSLAEKILRQRRASLQAEARSDLLGICEFAGSNIQKAIGATETMSEKALINTGKMVVTELVWATAPPHGPKSIDRSMLARAKAKLCPVWPIC